MQLYETNPALSEEKNLQILIPEEDEVLNTFQVVPLDYDIYNLSTPKIVLSRTKLLFFYNNYVEVYELSSLNFEILGEEPKFSAWQQTFESKYIYSTNNLYQIMSMRNDITVVRVSIFETGKIPKSFLLRNGKEVARPFQTWAMYQILTNTKNSVSVDTNLNEMVNGYFTTFNNKTVYAFIVALIGFLLLNGIVSLGLPEFIKTVLNLVFGVMCIAMLFWTYKSVEKNNKRFESVYLRYKSLVRPAPIMVTDKTDVTI